MSVSAIWVSDHTVVSIDKHSHDYFQLMYCQGGSGEIQIGNTVYPAVAGHAYLALPMQEHAIIQKDRLHLVEIKFTVDDEIVLQGLDRLPAEFSIDDSLLLRLAFTEIKREALSHALYSHESTNAALNLFLFRLVRQTYTQKQDDAHTYQNCFFNTGEKSNTGKSTEIDLVKILDYIETHLSEQITLNDLTSLVHLDKSYLISRFKKMWGAPPMQYINHLRIERSKVLLTMTDKSATEIALEVGFQSIHYFSRYFKEKEGLTPNEYREEHKKYLLKDITQ